MAQSASPVQATGNDSRAQIGDDGRDGAAVPPPQPPNPVDPNNQDPPRGDDPVS